MTAERLGWLKRGLATLGLLAVLLYVFLPRATDRKYPERKPIRFWHMWSAEWAEVVERICDRFNESQTEYEVIPLSVPGGGADTKFLLAVTGGDPPDVMSQWNAVIPTWADSGLLQPLDGLMTAEEKATFHREAYPVTKKLGLYKGRLYGLTIGMNAFAYYYLPEALEEQGVREFPRSLEEVVALGDKLNQKDGQGNLTRLGMLPPGWLGVAPAFGGGFYDWKAGEVVIDTPENLRALEWLVDERRKIGFDSYLRFQSGLNTASFAGGWPFIGGAYAVCSDGQWRVEQIRKFAPDLKYRTAMLPPPKGGRERAGFSGGNFMIVPKGAKNARGAWEFVKFWSGLTEPERAAEFYTWGGWLPLTPAIAESPIYQEYLRKNPEFRTFVELMPSENLEVLPPVPCQTYLNDRIYRAEDLALRGSKSPKEALAELAKDVAEERRRRKELGYDE